MKSYRFPGELIIFEAKDGLKIAGFLMRGTSKDIVLFVHGMGGHFYKDGMLKGAYILQNSEMGFFSISTRGAEIVKSFRTMDGEERYIYGTAFEKFEDCVKDIEAAIDLLESLGYTRIHLMGHSTGCQKILYYQHISKDDRIKSLIFLSPAEDYEIWKDELGEEFEKIVAIAKNMVADGKGDEIIIPLYRKTGAIWSAQRFLSFASKENPEAMAFDYDTLNMFSSIRIPVCAIFGMADSYFLKPIDYYVKQLRSAYKGNRLDICIIENADHSFHGAEDKVFQKIVGFIKVV